jgi:hypothetical protein
MGYVEIREDERVEEMLSGVDFVDKFYLDEVGVVYRDGESLDMLARESRHGIELVGWHAPYPPSSVPPETVTNVTSLATLPPGRQNVSTVGKGVGMRLANTWEASLGSTDGRASLYTCEINPDAIYDARRTSDRQWWGRAIRIAEHLGKSLLTYKSPARLEWLVDQVHISYEGADAVIWNQPPAGVLHQSKQGGDREILPSGFAIIRRPEVLRLAGIKIN